MSRTSHSLLSNSTGEFEGILLGDGGYPCLPYLLTPYSEPGTEAEEAFNGALNSTRARIEMVFGQLKSRFGAQQFSGCIGQPQIQITAFKIQYCPDNLTVWNAFLLQSLQVPVSEVSEGCSRPSLRYRSCLCHPPQHRHHPQGEAPWSWAWGEMGGPGPDPRRHRREDHQRPV